MTKQDIQSTNAKNVNSKNRKKTWLILGIILGVLLIPLVILDIRYRIDFAAYDAEVKRVASFLPAGTTEDPVGPEEYSHDQRGNGLWGCRIVDFGTSCPDANRGYIVKVEPGKEMDLGRKVFREAGYEVNQSDLEGTRTGVCSVTKINSCTIEAKTQKYSTAIMMTPNRKDPQGPIGLTISVRPNPFYEGK